MVNGMKENILKILMEKMNVILHKNILIVLRKIVNILILKEILKDMKKKLELKTVILGKLGFVLYYLLNEFF